MTRMRIPPLTRRNFSGLATAAALAPLGLRPAFADNPPAQPARRVIALDWGVAETLVGLGHPPLGAAEIPSYDRTVVTPQMPKNVINVGLRLAPNPELMQSLSPDLVLINAAQTYMEPSLAPFGRVEVVPIYTAAGEPYRLSCVAAQTLATQLGDPAAATRLLAEAQATMAATRARLAGYDGRPVYAIGFIDARHVAVAGHRSLIQGVFDQLGLHNAWSGGGGDWGIGTIGVEDLARNPEAWVIYRTPLSQEARRFISGNPLWLRLPFVRERRIAAMPPVWSFGALPSAMRIARLLGDALAPLQAREAANG